MYIWVRWKTHLAASAYFVEYSMLSVGSVENGLVWVGREWREVIRSCYVTSVNWHSHSDIESSYLLACYSYFIFNKGRVLDHKAKDQGQSGRAVVWCEGGGLRYMEKRGKQACGVLWLVFCLKIEISPTSDNAAGELYYIIPAITSPTLLDHRYPQCKSLNSSRGPGHLGTIRKDFHQIVFRRSGICGIGMSSNPIWPAKKNTIAKEFPPEFDEPRKPVCPEYPGYRWARYLIEFV